MNTYNSRTAPEEKSPTKGAWMAIHEKAPYSKKQIKCGPGRSLVFRHPEERTLISPKTLARKVATAAKIEGLKLAALKRRIMIENPLAKREKDGSIVLKGQRGEKGQFVKSITLLS